jgi:hypothetical protein
MRVCLGERPRGKVVPDAMGQDAQERLRGGPMEGNPSLPRGTLYLASPNRHRPSSLGTGIPSTRWPHHSTTLHGMNASRPHVGQGRFGWGRPRSSSQVGGAAVTSCGIATITVAPNGTHSHAHQSERASRRSEADATMLRLPSHGCPRTRCDADEGCAYGRRTNRRTPWGSKAWCTNAAIC